MLFTQSAIAVDQLQEAHAVELSQEVRAAELSQEVLLVLFKKYLI